MTRGESHCAMLKKLVLIHINTQYSTNDKNIIADLNERADKEGDVKQMMYIALKKY